MNALWGRAGATRAAPVPPTGCRASVPDPVRTVVRCSDSARGIGLRELWAHRELLFFFGWRDIKVRYKQTVLGMGWAVLQPVLAMVVFSVFFGRLAGVPSDGLPYPVFAYAALLPWQLFAAAVSGSALSVVGNQTLITKVYFPRLLVPIASVVAGLVDFAVACGVLLVLMAGYGVWPGRAVLAAPAFVLLTVASGLGAGLWLCVLNVRYRDVRYTIPFLMQVWMLATPVAYPASLVPERWRPLYALNPMVGVIEGFRWALLGRGLGPDASTFVSTAVIAALLAGGLIYFQRSQSTFADVV